MLTWQLFNKWPHQLSYWRGHSVTNATVEADGPLLIHANSEPLVIESGRAGVRVLPGSLLVLS